MVGENHLDINPNKPKRRRKRTGFLIIVLLIVGGYGAAVVTMPLAAVKFIHLPVPSLAAQNVSLTWPNYGQTAVGAPGYGVLASHGDTKPVPTASVAKVLTALAVMKQYPLLKGQSGPMLTISASDVANFQKYVTAKGSVVAVQLGEQLTEYQALQAMLLPSANNMADLLASWAFGSTNQYVTFANSFAKSLGLTQTTVADPSGFSSSTMSTAHDLVLLGENVMDNPVLAEIVDQPEATIPVAGTITNINLLVGHQEIVGIKTGNTDEAGGCFMVAARHEIDATHQVIVIAVTLGAPDLTTAINNILPLLQSAYNDFHVVTVVRKGTAVGEYQVAWGPTVSATTSQDIQGVVWKSMSPKAEVTIPILPAMFRGGSLSNGEVSATFGRQKVSSPLTSITIPPPTLGWRLSHPAAHV